MSTSTERPKEVLVLRAWEGEDFVGQALAYRREVIRHFGEGLLKSNPKLRLDVEVRFMNECQLLTWEKFLESQATSQNE